MWRAIILATVVGLTIQTFAAAPTSAGDNGGAWGQWIMGHGWADHNNDCIVDMIDAQLVAFRYGAVWPSPLYDQRFDVNPQHTRTGAPDDYDIDIKDLQYVFGRLGLICIDWWEVEWSMGMYSYKGSSNCVGSANYSDPITVVFTSNATVSRLEEEAADHGFPDLEYDDEQRFWEINECTYEDVDASYRIPGTGWPDPYEQWHFRAEQGPEGQTPGWSWPGYRPWGIFSVATPHFDDDINKLGCGHFVPEVFPHPEMFYPGFEGSGFDAGREYIYWTFVVGGQHAYAAQWWGNRTPIQQSCKDDEWPMADGWVYYVEIP